MAQYSFARSRIPEGVSYNRDIEFHTFDILNGKLSMFVAGFCTAEELEAKAKVVKEAQRMYDMGYLPVQVA